MSLSACSCAVVATDVVLDSATDFGTLVSPAAFGHSGATGTTFWADPVSDISCVILCNEMVGKGSLLAKVSNAVNASLELLEPPSRHSGAGPAARM